MLIIWNYVESKYQKYGFYRKERDRMSKIRYEVALADEITGEELQIIRDVLIGRNESACMMCKEPTVFIDICSEGHICSEYCNNLFYEMWSNHLEAQKRIED
jgi:hypothetical protein